MKVDQYNVDSKFGVYFDYLKEHTTNVELCYELLTGMVLNRKHDESKWDVEEFYGYAYHFYPETRPSGMTQEESDKMYDLAWSHHQKNNPHHWQYYVLINDGGNCVPMPMELDHLYELVADWASFALRKKDPSELSRWYNDYRDRIIMYEDTRSELESVLPIMVSQLSTYLNNRD